MGSGSSPGARYGTQTHLHGLHTFEGLLQSADQLVLDCRWYSYLPSSALVLACCVMPASHCLVAPWPGPCGHCSARMVGIILFSQSLWPIGINVTSSTVKTPYSDARTHSCLQLSEPGVGSWLGGRANESAAMCAVRPTSVMRSAHGPSCSAVGVLTSARTWSARRPSCRRSSLRSSWPARTGSAPRWVLVSELPGLDTN